MVIICDVVFDGQTRSGYITIMIARLKLQFTIIITITLVVIAIIVK